MRSVIVTCAVLLCAVAWSLTQADATEFAASCAAPAVGAANCSLPYGSVGCSEAAPAVVHARPRIFGRWHARKAARHASYAAGSAGATATYSYAPATYGNCVGGVCY
jgi:hypothetical protein